MRNSVLLKYFLLFLLFPISAVAQDDETVKTNKFGLNVLTLLVVGDINGSYEKQLNRHFAFVTTAHYITAKNFFSSDRKGVRATVGARLYGDNDFSKKFIEFKLGYGNLNSKDGKTSAGSLEAFIGHSENFTSFSFFEGKIGLMRFVESEEVLPALGFTIGVRN